MLTQPTGPSSSYAIIPAVRLARCGPADGAVVQVPVLGRAGVLVVAVGQPEIRALAAPRIATGEQRVQVAEPGRP